MHTETQKKLWKIGLHGLFQSVVLQKADVRFLVSSFQGLFWIWWLNEWLKSTLSAKLLCGWLSSRPAGWSCLGLPAASWTCLNLWVWTLLGSHWANNLYYCNTDAISFWGGWGEEEEHSASVQNKDFVFHLWQSCSSPNFASCPTMCRPVLLWIRDLLCRCCWWASHLTARVCNWCCTAFPLYTTEFCMRLMFAVQQNVSLNFSFPRLKLHVCVWRMKKAGCHIW